MAGKGEQGSGARTVQGVDVRDEGITTRTVKDGYGREEAAQRFGGVDLPATIAGALAGLGLLVILGGVLGAAGGYGYQLIDGGTDDTSVAVGGLVAGLVALVLAFLVGGWVAGRVARYDGGKNGLLAAVWFLVLGAVFGGLGAWAGERYDVFAELELPQWFTSGDATTASIISAVVGVLAVLLAGFLGGKLGERFHRRADATVAGIDRPGGLHRTDDDEVDLRRAEGDRTGSDR